MRWWLVVGLFLLILPVVVADKIDIALYQDHFSPSATVQVLVTVNEPPVYAPDVNMLHLLDASGSQVRIAPLVRRIRDNLFLYIFDVPQVPDSRYTLELAPLKYVVDAVLKEFRFSKELVVADDGFSLHLQPPFFVQAYNNELKVSSIKGDFSFVVEAPPEIKHVYSSPQKVADGDVHYFVFSMSSFVPADLMINLSWSGGKVFIPVFSSANIQDKAVVKNDTVPRFELSQLSFTKELSSTGSSADAWLLKNLGAKPLRVNFFVPDSLMGIVRVNESSVLIAPGASYQQFVWFNQEGVSRFGVFSGDMVLTSDYQNATVPVRVVFPEGSKPVVPPQPFVDSETNTVQPARNDSGFVDLEIFGNQTYTDVREKSSKTPLIFVLLLVVVAIIIYVLSRKKKTEQTFDQYLEEMRKRRP
ncbi:MAG TPA: hypothetical protein VJB87_05285 [Candidatus Nanoarchaeia archaeon]|nr:hypothetical protein [Candidatus Nanoarchaeia archaeon]